MRIAVVILNWNGKSFLGKYLPSVLTGSACAQNSAESSTYEVSVIVADNGSTDGSKEVFERVRGEYLEHSATLKESCALKETLWIQLPQNYGFTGGYNRAFKTLEGKYDYYVLLNSDIVTPARWLLPLADFMEAHPECGICQPKILSLIRHEKIQERSYEKAQRNEGDNREAWEEFEYAGACGGFIDRYGFPFCRGRILSEIEEDRGQYDTPLRTFWATGACMMIRARLFHDLGGLDETFFAHMEEIDLCWRAALLEHQIWCIPQSKIYHLGGGTLPNNSPRKLYLNYRNNLLMLWKNLPQKGKGAKIFLRKTIDGLSAIAYLLQGKTQNTTAVWRAHRDFNKIKKSTLPSPRAARFSESTVYGVYPHSIIYKFFTGKKKFSQINF